MKNKINYNKTNNKHNNIFKNIFIILSKIFFIWLLLQFVLQTFVSFKLRLTGGIRDVIWIWKELIVVILAILAIIVLFKEKKRKELFQQKFFKRLSIITWVVLVLITIISLAINHSDLTIFIASLKYSMSGFLIFLIFWVNAWLFLDIQNIKKDVFIRWYSKILKRVLLLSLIWWFIWRFAPRTFTFIGYNEYSYEGQVGVAPPATYLSQYNTWLIRNQFVFERPVALWFFLVVMWPLFFIRRKWRTSILFWWWIYWLNIFSTWSRAAWIAWIVLTMILFLLEYKKHLLKIAMYIFLPLLIIFTGTVYLSKDNVVQRDFSDKWHVENILTAINYLKTEPIWWIWAGMAWPVTHQFDEIKNYNPENQFLQIWLEYWIFWFLGWMWIFWILILVGVQAFRQIRQKKATKYQRWLSLMLFTFSLGLFWLSIEWLVLHSFVDRMIVYPFMALFAIGHVMYYRGYSH